MLAFLPQSLRTPHEYRCGRLEEGSHCCERALQEQLSHGVTSWEMGETWVGQARKLESSRCSCYRRKHRRLCSVPLLLVSLVLLCSVDGRAAFEVSSTNPPKKPGLPGGYVSGEDGGGRDTSGTSDGHEEGNTLASDSARTASGMHKEQLWQEQQQQPTAPRGGKAARLLPSWMNMFRFFDLPQQSASQNLPPRSQSLPPANLPQVQPLVTGTSSTAGPDGGPPGRLPHFEQKAAGAPTNGPAVATPLGIDITSSPQAESLKTGLNWLSPERQLSPEEEEEEALADAIIHGTGKKRVPRLQTAVDALIDAIEEQKLQQIAKTPGQLEYLRKRRQAHAQARESTVKVPDFFSSLAKEAAAYHKKKQQELQERETEHPVGSLGQQLRTLARRRQQKDKLLLWRENQIYQSPDEGPDLEKQIAEARRTDRELERLLLRDLSKEDLQWVTGYEEDQKEEASESAEDKVEGDKN